MSRFWFFLFSLVGLLSSLRGEERYFVDPLILKYRVENQKLPSIESLNALKIPLLKTDRGYKAPQEGAQITYLKLDEFDSVWLYKSALLSIGKAVVSHFNHLGVYGVQVAIAPYEINSEGEDIRPCSESSLTLYILHAEIGQIRTLNPEKEDLDGGRYNHISKNAPIREGSGDLLAPDKLQEYLYWLNRFPNRRVDLEIGSIDGLGLVGIDFIISEEKPWRVYLNVANTGPENMNKMQESVGFLNTQVTGNDDIFQVDFTTDSFSQFHAITAFYERPFLNYRRLRWKIQGDESRFSSAQLGFDRKEFVGSRYGGRFELNWNAYQKKDFFIDLLAAVQYRYFHVNNHLIDLKGQEDFLMPNIAFEMSRIRRTSLFYFGMLFFTPINGITGVKESNLDKLGRFDVSRHWEVLQGEAYTSFYLEALGDGPHKRLANEIFLYTQGQTSFGSRLIPEYQETLGGLFSVRGYPTALVAADHAITGVFEYRLHIPQLLKPSADSPTVKLFGKPLRVRPPYPGGAADWDLILRGFYDVGRGTNEQSSQSGVPKDPNETLMGAGVGLELIIRQNLFLRADNGWALRDVENIRKGNFEFYFSGTLVY